MHPTRFAPFSKRFAAFIVDVIVCGFISGLILLPLKAWVLYRFLNEVTLSVQVNDHAFMEELIRELQPGFRVLLVMILVSGLIHLLYFTLFESSRRQATPGKMILGLFVTDLAGQRLSFGRALGRSLGKIVSKMMCFLGYTLALFTERSQALHDLMAGSLVLEPDNPAPGAVRAPAAEPPQQAASNGGKEE